MSRASKQYPPIVSQIVNRCHVGESNRAVIRYFVSRVKRDAWRAMARKERHMWLRWVIACHEANGALYHAVMTGRF